MAELGRGVPEVCQRPPSCRAKTSAYRPPAGLGPAPFRRCLAGCPRRGRCALAPSGSVACGWWPIPLQAVCRASRAALAASAVAWAASEAALAAAAAAWAAS